MSFENLVVTRVVLHEVFKRRHDGGKVDPRHGDHLISLSAEAMNTFIDRIIDAMGAVSKSMEMQISKYTPESAVAIASALVGVPDNEFITRSSVYADMLADAQQAKNIPGGKVIVFSGTVGATSLPFVAVMKAEKSGGFREGLTALEYFNDIFLTAASKLYKIGFFTQTAPGQELPAGWRANIYDNQMVDRNPDHAAQYFYGHFLGCAIPENSAHMTRAFFEHTRTFVRDLPVEPEVREDLLTSLTMYLKVDQTPTIQVSAFSNSYIPTEARDAYTNFMESKRFPLNAVPKDTTEIKSKLRRRRVRFTGNIELTAPPESFKDLISMETVAAENTEPGQPTEWTVITIRDRIQAEE